MFYYGDSPNIGSYANHTAVDVKFLKLFERYDWIEHVNMLIGTFLRWQAADGFVFFGVFALNKKWQDEVMRSLDRFNKERMELIEY